MPHHKNQSIPLAITAISSDGNGVGRHDGSVVFVPDAAVGDELQVKIVKPAKTYAYGRIEQVVRPGPGRQPPDCPISTACGGCCFRHLQYDAELAAKQSFVADALTRIGKLDHTPLPIIPSPAEQRYRNKVQYPVTRGEDGALQYGFYASRSHRVIPCEDCLLQPQTMNALAGRIIQLLTDIGATAYSEQTREGLVRHITLRQGAHTDEILVCLVLNGDALPDNEYLVDTLTREYPTIKSIVLNTNRENTNVIHGNVRRVLYGPGFINDSIAGVPMQLNEHTFAQVNTPAAEQLFATARQLAAPNGTTTLLDLYCGTGVIGLSIASQCERVIGVEIVPEAVESARQNAAAMGIANTQFLCTDAGKAAETLAAQGTKPDVVVLDPPRKGVSPETLAAVVQMGPARIVMVSCNPATMARDVALLTQSGYRLATAQPVDLFPRTKHVECVCLLEKQA